MSGCRECGPVDRATKRYSVIYADPPWWYSSRSANRKTKFGGGARAHYPVMRDSEILAMADFVQGLAADNCVLCLWATGPRLDIALQTITAWGFRYATVGFTWRKVSAKGKLMYGPGYYTSSNEEFLLIGVRGSMPPARRMLPSAHNHPRLRHSEKPAMFRRFIEQMYPEAERIELFARHAVDGWDAWGNEVGKFVPMPRLDLEVA